MIKIIPTLFNGNNRNSFKWKQMEIRLTPEIAVIVNYNKENTTIINVYFAGAIVLSLQ